jgi:hypothetical protein
MLEKHKIWYALTMKFGAPVITAAGRRWSFIP